MACSIDNQLGNGMEVFAVCFAVGCVIAALIPVTKKIRPPPPVRRPASETARGKARAKARAEEMIGE